MASGCKLFAHYAVTRPYNVAILDLESRPWEVDQRLDRVALGLGVTADEIEGKVHVIRRRLRFDNPTHIAALIASLKEWGTEFLFVDSFRRTHGGNENASETTSALFLDAFDRIRWESSCGLILTDHTRKKTGDKQLDDPAESMRGSTDKRNMADAHFGLEEHNDQLAFIPSKTRHNRKPQPIRLEITGLDDEDAPDGPVCVLWKGMLDPASDAVQDEIWALLPGDKTMIARGEIIGRSRYAKRTVSDGLSALKKRERVRTEKRKKEVFYGRA